MNCSHGSVPQRARPGSGRVVVTELSGTGPVNPTPTPKSCEQLEVPSESYLSPETLEILCGSQELTEVTSLEICINTQDITLGNFGAYLPKLNQLKMNNSFIKSIRDLGCSLYQLQVLWLPYCSLEDLDGISSLSSLRELYLAYNRVSELSQVGMLENLHILDLEGNEVDDLVQIQLLGLCANLQNLTLDGNPICQRPNPLVPQTSDYNYRAAVRELVPQLRYLDNVSVEEDGQSCSSTLGEDWDALRNSIKEYSSTSATLDTSYDQSAVRTSPLPRPSSAWRPSTSLSSGRPRSSHSPRPLTGSRPSTAAGLLSPPGSRPGSSDSGLVETESSDLTHGAGMILFYGNPAQAIRARREKLRTAPTASPFTPRELPVHVPEHTYDTEEPEEKGRSDVFAELRAWRQEHSRRLEAIKTERLPQVWTIRQSDEEDTEEADSYSLSTDEEDEEEEHHQHSPDSLLQSPSPDLEELSPVAQRSSPDTKLLPSPPPSAESQGDHRKALGIRTRRLRLMQVNAELLPDVTCTQRHQAAVTGTEYIPRLTGTNVKLSPLPPRTPRPPPTKASGGLKPASPGEVSPCAASGIPKTLPPVPERPSLPRPHTARAALQTHYLRRVLEASRGSSQPD